MVCATEGTEERVKGALVLYYKGASEAPYILGELLMAGGEAT